MKLRLLNETLHTYDDFTRKLIVEQPHVRVVNGSAPPDLKFLVATITDLGWEDMHLPKPELAVLYDGWSGKGVAFPGTSHRLLRTNQAVAVVEPADGDEPVLPASWRRTTSVLNDKDEWVWIGDMVRRERVGDATAKMRKVEDGWVLNTAILGS